MIILKRFEKVFDVISELAAFLTIALIAVLFLNTKYAFFDADLTATLQVIKEYAILGTLIAVGLEFVSKRSIILVAIYFVVVAVAVIYSFPALF